METNKCTAMLVAYVANTSRIYLGQTGDLMDKVVAVYEKNIAAMNTIYLLYKVPESTLHLYTMVI